MTVEDRLSRALEAEAKEVDVDLPRAYAGTRTKIRSRQTSRRRSRTSPALLIAAGVAVITIGSATLSQGWPGWGELGQFITQDTGDSSEGGVDDTFTCTAQATVVFDGRLDDDSFLPSLSGGPEAAAEDVGAPRYEYLEDADRARLRMGNADGTLANVSNFHRAGSQWVLTDATTCTGGHGGVLPEHSAETRLGAHGVTPWPADGLIDPRYVDGDAVLLDDRPLYDTAGLMTHRSIYAAPCDGELCINAGEPTSMMVSRIRSREDLRPVDISGLFLPPDDMVGKVNPYGVWALYDTAAEVKRLTVTLDDGSVITAREFGADNWDGRVFAVLATFREVSAISVLNIDGESESYEPEELPGFEPRSSGG